jgi:predicted O-methyltransferase YrrM
MGFFKKLLGGQADSPEQHIPGNAADKRLSAVYSFYEQPGKPSDYLLDLSIKLVNQVGSMNLDDIATRIPKSEVDYISIYPGEHYKLLAALISILQPKTVVELGTHLGYSSLCMKKFMPSGGTLHTFDVIPWNGFSETILRETDFDGQLVQHLDDTTNLDGFNKHRSLFEQAEIIFMDALKDGVQEYQFLKNFATVNFKQKCLFVFDDIRLWNMLDIWFNMDKPKMDLTSFGHWSGTGLVDWCYYPLQP